MHYLIEISSSANPDLNFWVSKLSKNSYLGVQMTRWTHRCFFLKCQTPLVNESSRLEWVKGNNFSLSYKFTLILFQLF